MSLYHSLSANGLAETRAFCASILKRHGLRCLRSDAGPGDIIESIHTIADLSKPAILVSFHDLTAVAN